MYLKNKLYASAIRTHEMKKQLRFDNLQQQQQQSENREL